jgi:dephospho-CoA kinase
MLIIGITGTLGAGKGTIVDYLIKEKGFKHFSVRAFIAEEIVMRGMAVNRDSMVLVANDLRKKNSPSYIIDRLYEKAIATGRNSIIESIRTPGEVYSLREKGRFYLLAVDADPEVRYQRISVRNSETDNVSFETFLENEKREMNSSDPNAQDLSKCIELADFRLRNNGTIEQLNKQTEEILLKIKEDRTVGL